MDSNSFHIQVSKLAHENARSVTSSMLRSTSPQPRNSPRYFNPDALLDSLASEISSVIETIRTTKMLPSDIQLPFSISPSPSTSPSTDFSSVIYPVRTIETPKVTPKVVKKCVPTTIPSSTTVSRHQAATSSPPRHQTSSKKPRPLNCARSVSPSASPPNQSNSLSESTSSLIESNASVDTNQKEAQKSKKLTDDQFDEVMSRWKQAENDRRERLEKKRKEREDELKQSMLPSPKINPISQRLAVNRESVINRSSASALNERRSKVLAQKMELDKIEQSHLRGPELSKMAKKLKRGINVMSDWEKSRKQSIEEKRKSLIEQQEASVNFHRPKLAPKSEMIARSKLKGRNVVDRLANQPKLTEEVVESQQLDDSKKLKQKELARKATATASRLYKLGVERQQQKHLQSTTESVINSEPLQINQKRLPKKSFTPTATPDSNQKVLTLQDFIELHQKNGLDMDSIFSKVMVKEKFVTSDYDEDSVISQSVTDDVSINSDDVAVEDDDVIPVVEIDSSDLDDLEMVLAFD
ncbi:hypothetical protein RCL1_001059 [Eukaryota sp. TZLM3-RCL]